MIPKNSARICWKVMLLVLLLIIPGRGHSSNNPPWLQAYQDGTLKLTKVYYGVGSADFIGDKPQYESRRRSKDRALLSSKSQGTRYPFQGDDAANRFKPLPKSE